MRTDSVEISLLATLVASPVLAAPTAQVAGGNTTVELDEEFVGTLVSLGVTPDDIEPGRLKGLRARFPLACGSPARHTRITPPPPPDVRVVEPTATVHVAHGV